MTGNGDVDTHVVGRYVSESDNIVDRVRVDQLTGLSGLSDTVVVREAEQ
jgi:hypothetical protein